MFFYLLSSTFTMLKHIPCQISLPPDAASTITETIASSPYVQLTGLGARDSLRLEAGMCLYGNDLDESISPVEAGLAWVVGKSWKTIVLWADG